MSHIVTQYQAVHPECLQFTVGAELVLIVNRTNGDFSLRVDGGDFSFGDQIDLVTNAQRHPSSMVRAAMFAAIAAISPSS